MSFPGSRDYRRKLAKEIIDEALARLPRQPKDPLPLKVPVRGKPLSRSEEDEIRSAARVTAQKALARLDAKIKLKKQQETPDANGIIRMTP